ncbi:hypothetical protein BLA29_005259 [Euroglyphus maynei]|uniref:DFP2-like protein n=1 Tax=Euroglyphus maynei TaxID=6958 RepID=A0A1Y3BHJ4_EURMA|nr:hypothetical protein BLA29_005259 [Euroglyphus maynei]
MFKYIVAISSMIVCCIASGYGGGGMSRSGYAGGSYGSGGGGGSFGGGYGGFGGGIIPIAIHSRHNVQFYDVPSTGMVNPTTIEGLYQKIVEK